MLYHYGDESGKACSSDFVSLCGYTIDHKDVREFSTAWINCLERWMVPPIHLREIYHLNLSPNKPDRWLQKKTEWGRHWERRRDEMLSEFASLVLASSVKPVGTVLDAKHFRSGACPQLGKRVGGDPIYLAFRRTVLFCIENIKRSVSDPGIGIVVDDDKDTSVGFHKWVNEIKHDNQAPLGKLIKSLCFVDDKSFPLIQAADMLAYAARQRLVVQTTDDTILPAAIYERLTKKLDQQPEILDASSLDRLEQEEIDAKP
ncbi:MAG: DUF3800 domain-containing protein [Terracidiphilus sp.]